MRQKASAVGSLLSELRQCMDRADVCREGGAHRRAGRLRIARRAALPSRNADEDLGDLEAGTGRGRQNLWAQRAEAPR